MANGTFTDVNLVKIQAKINDVLGNENSVSRHNLSYDPVTGKALLENQRNVLSKIEDKGKEFTLSVTWLQEDGTAVTADPDVTDCAPDGEELGGYKQDYTMSLTDGAEITLKLNTADLRGLYADAEEARAVIIAQGMKRIAEAFNKDSFDFLAANIGTSTYVPETLGDVTSNSSGIEVPYANYVGDKLIPEMVVANEVNNLRNSFLIGGPFFHVEWQKAMKDAANDNGKGTGARWNELNWYFDNRKMAALSGKPIFQVSPLAYAAAIKNRHDAAPKEIKGKDQYAVVYTLANPYLPGVSVDIYESHQCSGSDRLHPVITWTFTLHYKHFLNPKGVQAAISGIQPAETANSGILKWFQGAQAS